MNSIFTFNILIIFSIFLLAFLTGWILHLLDEKQKNENRSNLSKKWNLFLRILIPISLFILGLYFMMKDYGYAEYQAPRANQELNKHHTS